MKICLIIIVSLNAAIASNASPNWCKEKNPSTAAFNEAAKGWKFTTCEDAYLNIHADDMLLNTEEPILNLAPLKHFFNISSLTLYAKKVQNVETLCQMNLESLSLSISETDSDDCPGSCLKSLKWLSLTGTEKLIEESIKGLAHPEGVGGLSLSLVAGGRFNMGVLNSLAGLKSLGLDCKNSEIDFSEFQAWKLPDLKRLMISNCNLLGGSAIPAMISVEDFRWNSSDISDLGCFKAFFSDAPNLQKLDLGWNKKLSDIKALRYLNSPNLIELGLGWTGIKDGNLRDLAHLNGLSTLNINNADIKGEGISDLKALSNLKTLDLDECLIDDAGLKYFESWPTTSKLGVW